LLHTLEAPFTMALAVLLYREHLGRAAALSALLVLAGSLVLALGPGPLRVDLLGAAAVAGACLSWGIDNNLTQRLSLRDPVEVVTIKTLSAGLCSGALAIARGAAWPPATVVAAALVLGVFSYGISIVLDVYALRLLGAAREAAFFATAPFAGALAAVPILGERIRPLDLGAAALMLAGVVLLVRERHEHPHTHEALEHEHLHSHDAHHQHAHPPGTPTGEPHSHRHRHEPLNHTHRHMPDLHHRHRH
jgi:drug/metabolite transporter (DMT)-like permease